MKSIYRRVHAAWIGCFLSSISTATAAEIVTVDLGTDGGEIRHRASGFLHGFSDDGQAWRQLWLSRCLGAS